MTQHILTIRREERFSLCGTWRTWKDDRSNIDIYPCLDTCINSEHILQHRHTGHNVFIYGHCSCGWKKIVGDHINVTNAVLEARLLHLQHQIDILESTNTSGG